MCRYEKRQKGESTWGGWWIWRQRRWPLRREVVQTRLMKERLEIIRVPQSKHGGKCLSWDLGAGGNGAQRSERPGLSVRSPNENGCNFIGSGQDVTGLTAQHRVRDKPLQISLYPAGSKAVVVGFFFLLAQRQSRKTSASSPDPKQGTAVACCVFRIVSSAAVFLTWLVVCIHSNTEPSSSYHRSRSKQ